MEKLINNEHLSNIKFAADCAIKEPDSIYSQEFFMLLDETFGSKGDYESPAQAVAVAWLINRVNELEQRAEAAEAKLAELEKQAPVPMRYRWCPPHMKEADGSAWIGEWKYCDLGEANPRKDYERQELFTRPAPAADLAELVPQKMTNPHQIAAEGTGWNVCIDAILRKIEEASRGK